MKAWITNQDIYLWYRHKKQDIEGSKVWYPYIKKEDSSDHQYALTFRQWQIIVSTYFEILVDKMIEGYKFDLPKRLGTICLLRDDEKKVKGGILFRNLHTMGFHPMVAWFRHKGGVFRRKRWYKFNLSRRIVWKKISDTLFEEPHMIYNYDLNSKKDR